MVNAMNLNRVLSPAVIDAHLASDSKEAVINELLAILLATGKVKDEERARNALFDRERKMSTGMEHGIAIPHGKTEAVDELVACIGVSRDGIDFESLDGKPSHIFIMTLSPANRTGPHIQFLAEISSLLRDADRREKIRNAGSPEAILETFVS